MTLRIPPFLSRVVPLLALFICPVPLLACAPCPPHRPGEKEGVIPVVNADQTVIIIWDAATKTEHFIRQASFKSDADDFGFVVPTPNQPEMDESGNLAFPYLRQVTAQETKKVSTPWTTSCCCCNGLSCGTPTAPAGAKKPEVTVLEEKLVAGFHAAVLESNSADALVRWLNEREYAYSSEMATWAKPYVEAGWKFAALKVSKDRDGKSKKDVAASSLRLTFKTDRPLFPYREPDPTNLAKSLGVKERLLRIFFIADARYTGKLEGGDWSGKAKWSDNLTNDNRTKLLDVLKLPATTGPPEWWLTEFEDWWPYRAAPGDLYFSSDANQKPFRREPAIQYVALPIPMDVTLYALATFMVVPLLWRRLRRRMPLCD